MYRFCFSILWVLLLLNDCNGKGIVSSHVRTGKETGRWKYSTTGNTAMGFSINYGYYTYNRYREERKQNGTWTEQVTVRSTSCIPTGGQNMELTGSWLVVLLQIEKVESVIAEFETDINAELLFRAPCNPPTYTSILRICSLNSVRPLTEEDRIDVSVCFNYATFQSEHNTARRRLLQVNPNNAIFVEVAIGARSSEDGMMMAEALDESMEDPESQLKSQYNMIQLYDWCVDCSSTATKTVSGTIDTGDDVISTAAPTGEPTSQPAGESTNQPTDRPTGEPTSQPAGESTNQPTDQPTGEPTSQATIFTSSPKSNSSNTFMIIIVIAVCISVLLVGVLVGWYYRYRLRTEPDVGEITPPGMMMDALPESKLPSSPSL